MNVVINQPIGFSELGQRANNEDSLYPPLGSASVRDRLFMVCDGVGGQQKGEVASELACRTLADYFQSHPVEVSDEAYLQNALDHTHQAFRAHELLYPDTEGMATTLTLLHFHEAGATLGHLGDSRIYQVRQGQIVRMTEDHKLVNELVREGSLTPEEALNHSQRNVITRVISADRSDAPEVHIIHDVQPGDYFFLCTDGVLEQLYDDLLAYHLRPVPDDSLDDAQRLENIRKECMGKTRDNFTAYLVKVDTVSGALLPGHTVSLPAMISRSELPVAQPIGSVDFRQSYESDSPTQFTSSISASTPQRTQPDHSALAGSSTYRKSRLRKATSLVLGVVFGSLLTGAIWIWTQSRASEKVVSDTTISQKPLSPKPIEQGDIQSSASPRAASPSPTASRKDIRSKENKPVPIILKEETTTPEQEIVITTSKNYGFKIVKSGNNYFTIETNKNNKRTKIKYDYGISETGNYHVYSYTDKQYLYLEKPDKKIGGVEKVNSNENYITCFIKNIKFRIDPGTGIQDKIGGVSVDELKHN
ncbi:MAG: protein phosphatase 2C domain-containing protein [Bacteroidetes bacterium]|nr:protein phosphatase 2C domain-containing protein [Bacteroidota bacterium]